MNPVMFFILVHVLLLRFSDCFHLLLCVVLLAGGADGGLVSTDGGRYDVDIPSRNRKAVYWDEPESKVRRCSWFYRNDGDSRLVPYDEEFADKLEASIQGSEIYV